MASASTLTLGALLLALLLGPATAHREERGIFNLDSGESCLGTDRVTPGVCLSRTECGRQGGRVAGFCGVFSTCCALQTCDIVTRAKDAIFSNPPLTSQSSGLECSYNVEINNPRVCQIRIDLDIFTLSQPTLDTGGERKKKPVSEKPATDTEHTTQGKQAAEGIRKKRQTVGVFSFACRNDVFQVTNLQAFSEIIPPLCGENSGQHLYVRVNASLNSRALRINFKIADRQLRTDLSAPSWRIRIRQLECYNTRGLQRWPSYLEVLTQNYPVPPFLGYTSHILGKSGPGDKPRPEEVDSREGRIVGKSGLGDKPGPAEDDSRKGRIIESSAAADEFLIAPPGCLQYYPDRSGAFESFNYNGGRGPYLGNMRYATCFRRSVDVCGIKYTSSFFVMDFQTSLNQFLDTDCEKNPYLIDSSLSTDYLFIPDGQTADGRRGSKWCGNSASDGIIASFPPGPLSVFFNSDNVVNDANLELGYRFNYNVLNNCGS